MSSRFFDRMMTIWGGGTGGLEDPGDTNAAAGFEYLGTTTPSKQLFNWLFQISDQKVSWLYQQLSTQAEADSVTLADTDYTALSQIMSKRVSGTYGVGSGMYPIKALIRGVNNPAICYTLNGTDTWEFLVRDTSLNAEITARQQADTALQSNITAEGTARQTAVAAEATSRAQQDTVLQNNINAEATTRSQNDTLLSTNLASEITARQQADTALQTNIDNEATVRQQIDAAIYAYIAANCLPSQATFGQNSQIYYTPTPSATATTTHIVTLTFTAPYDGLVFATASFNVSNVQPSQCQGLIEIEGSSYQPSSGSQIWSDTTLYPMSGSGVMRVKKGDNISVLTSYNVPQSSATFASVGQTMTYQFTPAGF